MKDKIQNLRNKVSKYFENFDELNNRRTKWNTETKEFIHSKLTEINDCFPKLVWFVGKNEHIKNLESVYWEMGNEMAGFAIKNKFIIRKPGYLNYAQLANGKIIVMIAYPTIEENIRNEIEPKIIGDYLPDEINEKLIIKHAEAFIDEINDWTMNLDK
ncbi:hypothetical protein [Flavivirga eckloniae]|uniref:Uncharacterized protein n=1 Tax=Flavivirga eckloniae TaxID=1803846 RepID=A0A2K9PUN8_9FLAO|nr:hypothetical protein [Flavivirga eckloniae]AUP80781.1 hypothetical protein C1H87_19500 [Flavivirga eckloniae]